MMSVLSKYRTELMGYTMLFVLIGHIITLGGLVDTDLGKDLLFIKSFLPVTGFLFFSGFGMMFSLRKNDDWKEFYKRRFYRFWLPFWCLAIPYFLIVTISKHESILYYLSCISTAEFWVSGNYHGMWYIAISLLLYIITPPIYSIIKKSNFKSVLLIAIILVSIGLGAAIEYVNPSYWNIIGLGIARIPYFFFGMLFGYYAQKGLGNRTLCLFLVVDLCLYFLLSYFGYHSGNILMGSIMLVIGVAVVSTIVYQSSHTKILTMLVNTPLKWMGKYSYELYMLHLYLWFIIKGALHLNTWQNITLACALSLILAYPIHIAVDAICGKIQKIIEGSFKQ